jgi:hypothetical protein
VIRVGDIVKYWFDTGAFGLTTIYGIVERAGPKQFTVRWESGIRNRLNQGHPEVKLVTNSEELSEFGDKLKEHRNGLG